MTAYFRQESSVNKQTAVAARVLMLQGVHGRVKRLGLGKEVKHDLPVKTTLMSP